MRVEIVNERLLPRFGVDRILVLLARHLVAQGHEVGFASMRSEPRLLSAVGESTTLWVPPGLDIMGLERETARLMHRHLRERRPDAVVSGGWPFFRATREAGELGIAGLFIDAGAVAQDGMPADAVAIQSELRRVRQCELPGIDRVLPISRFIRDSQTLADRGRAEGVRTVLLGGDHMRHGLFPAGEQDDAALLARLRGLRDNVGPLILLLGRFEAMGYKNAPAAYGMLRAIRAGVPGAQLLILDAGANCAIPADLTDAVVPLGQPDDATLQAVMALCPLGLSPTLWEGFNLPIVEMQELGRPALAFNLGAHPEVIAHPWLLCDTAAEMARKAVRILAGAAPEGLTQALAASGGRLPWSSTFAAWEEEIVGAVQARRSGVGALSAPLSAPAPQLVLVDVTRMAAEAGAMPGLRQLCAVLQERTDVRLVFAHWDAAAQAYRLLDAAQRQRLGATDGPVDRLARLADGHDLDALLLTLANFTRPAVLLLAEGAADAAGRLAWADGRRMPVASLVVKADEPAVGTALPVPIEVLERLGDDMVLRHDIAGGLARRLVALARESANAA
jgi:glycosyltransferase involved in cell wall biosynthesis